MRIMKASGLLLVASLIASPLLAQEHISHGRFEDVTLYLPKGEPKQFVLFLSGDNGWEGAVDVMARKLVEQGAMVAGIDVTQLFESLEKDGAGCVFPDGDLENLSHYVQGYAQLLTYHTPLLVGYSSGASLAYAMEAQAPAGTFLGAMSLGFCVDMDLSKPLCRGEGVHFARRPGKPGLDLLPSRSFSGAWVAIHGTRDQVCPLAPAKKFAAQVPRAQFVELAKVDHDYAQPKLWQPQFLAAYQHLTANAPALPAPPVSLADLPLIELRTHTPGPTLAVLLSGDGGWAGLDKKVAAALVEKGVDVVGVDSLRYFWTKRTPQGLAVDLDRIVRYYTAQWHDTNVVLIGYSQGADVLPFAINRLPDATRPLITHSVMLGLGQNASFEFHVGNWLSDDDPDALPILPEATRLQPHKTLCIYGADEKNSLCPQLAPGSVEAYPMKGGHHFDGAYEELAAVILEHVTK